MANKVVTLVDWQNSGTDSRSLHDRGKSSTASTRAETEYDNGTNLSGPFTSTGKVAGEYSLNMALAAVAGSATVNSKVTSDTESTAKLAGTITVDEKSFGPNQFTRTLKNKTTFGADDNTQKYTTAGLVIVDGKPQTGMVRSEVVLLGSDTVDSTTTGRVEVYLNGMPILGVVRTEDIAMTEKWWGTATKGLEVSRILYASGIASTIILQEFATNGGNSVSGSFTVDQKEPFKSISKTTWQPSLATPDRGAVSGTFQNTRRFLEVKTGDVLSMGEYVKTSKSASEQTIIRSTENDLSAPNGQTGKEVWKSTTRNADSSDRSEDKQVVAGAWNDLLVKFNDSTFKSLGASHDKDSVLRPSNLTRDITTVRDVIYGQSSKVVSVGQRGRGLDAATQTVTNKLSSKESTVTDRAYFIDGILNETKSEVERTSGGEVVQNYEWAFGVRKLVSVTPSKIHRTSFTTSINTTIWTGRHYRAETIYDRSVSGVVGQVRGTRIDYNHTTTQTRNRDGVWSVASDSTFGSRDEVDVKPEAIDWFYDTWVNAAWTLASETWIGQGVSWTWNHGQEVAQIAGGVSSVAYGASMVWTGVGTLPGLGFIALGLDQIATGSINIRYGRVNQGFSILEFGVYRATGSETVAFLVPGLFSLGFGSVGSLGRLGARGAGATIDFAGKIPDVGTRLYGVGGQLYGVERLGTLGRFLSRRGVTLVLNADVELAGNAGAFTINRNGTVRLLLRTDPSTELVWHELSHFVHWRRIGTDAYKRLSRRTGNNVPEQFVFDLLELPGRWDRLSPGYRLHMTDYIEDLGGIGR